MESATPGDIEHRELGRTCLRLSCIGFGASPLGNVFGVVSEEDAIASVSKAFRLGINFFDTSPYYGDTLSEKVLGQALRALEVPRNQYIVSTKCGRYTEGFDFSAERVTRSIDESLARLQLDYVDILHCHDIEFGSLDQIIAETIPALQKLKERGKIRFIGITGLPLKIFTYVLDRVLPGTVDVILSYCHYSINDSSLDDLLPYLKSKSVGIISASPLSMGLLTENGPPKWHPASTELKAACQVAVNYCKGTKKSISKLALQYSLCNKDISCVLVGMNSVQQVEENVSTAKELALSGKDEEALSEIDAILKLVKNQTWSSEIQLPESTQKIIRTRGADTYNHVTTLIEQHPGPDDTSVLRLQSEHRSEEVWTGEEFTDIRVRQHYLMSLHPRVRPFIIQAGFIGVTQVGHLRIDTNLIFALLERWRRETHTFHLRVGEMTPSLADVAHLLALPIDGYAVTSSSNFAPDELCELYLGIVPPPKYLRGVGISLHWLREKFEKGPADDATDEVLLYHARAYILHMLGSVLFTSLEGNRISIMFLPLLRTMEDCRLYSWGSAVLAHLYRQMCGACMIGRRQIGGCVLLLQLWSWEHLHVGRPHIFREREHGVVPNDPFPPIGARWNNDLSYRDTPHHSLSFYRDEFDFQESHQVVWTPYENYADQLPQLCHESHRLWLYQGPLISFDIVEIHCVDRVLRQFGLGQHIPDPVDTIDSLHVLSRRGRSDMDWATHHARWIYIWDTRLDHLVEERYPHTPIDEYMQWYSLITRRVITRRTVTASRRPRLQYHPSGRRLQRLVTNIVDETRSAARAFLRGDDHHVALEWLISCSRLLDSADEGHYFRRVLEEEGIDPNVLAQS